MSTIKYKGKRLQLKECKSFKQWLSKISVGDNSTLGVIKKEKGRTTTILWWENKEKWFLNCYRNKKNPPTWIIKPDVHKLVDFYTQKNHKLYITV